jgi:hypothetical protein
MLSNVRSTLVDRPAPGPITDTISGSDSDQAPVAAPNTARAGEAAAAANGTETHTEHFRRKAIRDRLHGTGRENRFGFRLVGPEVLPHELPHATDLAIKLPEPVGARS